MAADSKDTAVTDENTETAVEAAPEATAAKSSKASSAPAKKLSPEALIRSFESSQQKDDLPEIYVGDTVRVGVRISEGNKERVQPYEGVVISKRHGGLNQTITVRRIFQGIGVERVFMLHSPQGLPSRWNGAVKCAGRSFSICGNGWARPPVPADRKASPCALYRAVPP